MTHNPPLILIVDDQPTTVEMYSRLLELHQYDTIAVLSGHEALRKAHDHLPDLILLDLMMPIMSGHEVLQALKSDSRTAHIPIMILTAQRDSIKDIELGFGMGAEDYIPKPTDPRELLARVKAKLEAKRYRDALRHKSHDLQQLLDFSVALNARLDLQAMIQRILEFVPQLRHIAFAAIHYRTAAETITRLTSDAWVEKIDEHLLRYTLDRLIESDTNALDVSIGEAHHAVAYAICDDTDVCGVLMIAPTEELDNDLHVLHASVARQASLALRNASLYHLQHNYATDLQRTVERRTEDLRKAQHQLIRAEKLASVGRLASAIAHEVNNPLTPVVLNLEMMVEDLQRHGTIAISAQEVLATFHSAMRVKRTLERVLQFTRNAHHDRSVLHELNLNDLLQNLLTLSRHYFSQASIETRFIPDPTLPMIMGNSDQLEQVFLNMMINARDAMPAGGRLTISTMRQSAVVQVRIEDTGSGIESHILPRLFEPFTSSKGDQGSGLGLYVSYEIINTHQGKIHVESAPGQGTCFTVELPSALSAQAQ